TTSGGKDPVKTEDFYQLLITQLQSQDPLKPADNQAILQQVSMIRQLQASDQLNRTLTGLSADQRLGTTASLIGKFVIGSADTSGGDGTPVQGVVVGVTYSQGNAVLQLHNGKQLPADKVETITLVDNLPPGTVPSSVSPTGTTPSATNASPTTASQSRLKSA